MKRIFALAIAVIASLCASAATKNLVSAAKSNGITLYWDALAGSGILEKNGHHVSFRLGDSMILLDYNKVALTDAPFQKDGRVMVSDKFLSQAMELFKTDFEEVPYKVGAVLIDPGHGGRDPGASKTHVIDGKKIEVLEKDVNLNVALKLRDLMAKKYPDKQIIMTRSTDKTLTLAQRTEIANTVRLKPHEAVLYVSIHVNSNSDPEAAGFEVWYLSPGYRRQVLSENIAGDTGVNSILNDMLEEEYTTESIIIAKYIDEALRKQVGSLSRDRGIKSEEWYVCRNAFMPSVLVETGFLTNPREAQLLCDRNYLQKLALGIYNGMSAFITQFEKSKGFTK